jgi:predicted DCC family thiol-disulfide oxidoreductase YuxK
MRDHSFDPDKMHSLVLIEGTRLYTRSDAAIRIVVELSGMWPIVGFMRLIPRPLRNAGYDLIARNRYKWFGRSNSCMAPTEENMDRLLR